MNYNLLKAYFYDYSLQILQVFLGLISVPLYISYIGEELYAKWLIILAIIGYIGLSDLGFNNYLIKKFQGFKDKESKKEFFNSIFSVSTIMSLIIILLFIIIVEVYANLNEHSVINKSRFQIYLLLTATALANTLSLFTNLLSAQHKFQQFSILSSVGSPVTILSTILLGLYGFGFESFIIGYTLGLILPIFFSIYIEREYTIRINVSTKQIKSHLKGFFVFSKWFVVTKLGKLLRDNSDLLIIGYFLDSKQLLIYSIAIKIPFLLVVFISRFATPLIPLVAKWVENQDRNKMDFLINFLNKELLAVLILSSSIFIINFELFIHYWVGEEYYAGHMFAILLAIVLLKDCHISIVGTIIFYSSQIKNQSLYLFIESLMKVILSIILVQKIEIYGPVVASLITGLITMFLAFPFFLSKILKVPIQNFWNQIRSSAIRNTSLILVVISYFLLNSFLNPNILHISLLNLTLIALFIRYNYNSIRSTYDNIKDS